MKFILMFLFSMIVSPTIALSSGTMWDMSAVEEYDVYNDFDVKDYTDTDVNIGESLAGNFNCEIIIVIIDFGNNYRRTNHRVFGNGRSFSQSRSNAFRGYESFINKHRFWRNRFNHSFRYRNCFSHGG